MGKAEGKAEGKVEGKVEGKAEGKAEAETEGCSRLVQRPKPPDVPTLTAPLPHRPTRAPGGMHGAWYARSGRAQGRPRAAAAAVA